jgi:hypothetical protein
LDRNVLTWLDLPLVIAGGTVANAVAVETTPLDVLPDQPSRAKLDNSSNK